jgi:competence protein ComGC
MKALQGIRVTSLLMAIVMLATLFVPAVSAQDTSVQDMSKDAKMENAKVQLAKYNITQDDINYYSKKGFDAEKILKVESRVRYLQSLPEVIKQAPYSPMVSADTETQQAILRHIGNFSCTDAERQEIEESMKDIWSRFPDKITTDDYPTLTKIGTALDEYLAEAYVDEGLNRGIIVNWAGTGTNTNVHGDLIYYGVNGVYSNTNWATTAKNHANDPDSTDSGVARYYNHFYRPHTPYLGSAPGKCLLYATYAKNNYASNKDAAFLNLGISSHYLSDVGNPMHTDGPVEQAIDKYFSSSAHLAYETYVMNNWASGFKFRDIVSSNTVPISVTDPSNAAKNLASYSNQYYNTLWSQVTKDPTQAALNKNSDVWYITTQVIRQTAKYNRGLAAYIKT